MGTQNEWEGPRELVRPWGSGVGSAVHCSGVTSDNGPAVTSRNCVLDPRKNETLDIITSKQHFVYRTHHNTLHYAVSSNPLSPGPSSGHKVFLSTLSSNTLCLHWSVCVTRTPQSVRMDSTKNVWCGSVTYLLHHKIINILQRNVRILYIKVHITILYIYIYIHTYIYIRIHTPYSTLMSTSGISHTLEDEAVNPLIPTKYTI